MPDKMPIVEILEWRPVAKGALRGFARVVFPSGVIFNEVAILVGDHGPWASAPSKPVVRDGAVVKDRSGGNRYTALVEFATVEVRNRWSAAVIEAMRAAHPEALT